MGGERSTGYPLKVPNLAYDCSYKAPASCAARGCRFLSGHALMAPFLLERWGRGLSDQCRWCGRDRQSREHLFNECPAWETGIRELWGAVGSIAVRRKRPECTGVHKSRKSFRYAVQCSSARPSNLAIRDLLSDNRFTGAVIDFLKSVKVEAVRSDVRQHSQCRVSLLPFGQWQVPLSRRMVVSFLVSGFMAGSSLSLYGNFFFFGARQT